MILCSEVKGEFKILQQAVALLAQLAANDKIRSKYWMKRLDVVQDQLSSMNCNTIASENIEVVIKDDSA